jgi:glycosyltransferase involved in cell wall biosynthesis
MCPDKGLREAIAVARAAGVPLRIAAKMREDAEHDYYEAEIAPLLGGEVQYVGELDENGKYELLGAAAALLNPIQWSEPFGLVMIEALACGTPVVATREGSVPEIVDDGRTGFVRDEVDDLAACLTEATHLDRGACREAAETRFSTSRMVSDHLDLYRDLTSQR